MLCGVVELNLIPQGQAYCVNIELYSYLYVVDGVGPLRINVNAGIPCINIIYNS